jgi:hypothetical protein
MDVRKFMRDVFEKIELKVAAYFVFGIVREVLIN